MILTCYDSILLFKNYNILTLYDYRYHCDFKILFNIFIHAMNFELNIAIDYLGCFVD